MSTLNAAMTKIAEQETKLAEMKAKAIQADANVTAALNPLTENNTELNEWLKGNNVAIQEAFEGAKIARISKKDKAELAKAVASIVAGANPEHKFIIDNASAVVDSFRFPTVKRMTAEDITKQANEILMDLTEGNAELTAWMIAKKDQLLAAFAAGEEKRAVSEKATLALAKYQADQLLIKATAAGMSVEDYKAMKAAEKLSKASK